MAISVRKAKISDASALCDAEKAWAREPGYLVSLASELESGSFERSIETLNQGAKGLYLVAVSDESGIVGHAFLHPMGLQAISHVVRLTIVIHRGFEGRGIGKILMHRVVDWARETEGVDKIELLVRASNERAISLYKRFGFEEEGRLLKRIKVSDGNYLDDISMGLLVK